MRPVPETSPALLSAPVIAITYSELLHAPGLHVPILQDLGAALPFSSIAHNVIPPPHALIACAKSPQSSRLAASNMSATF